MSDYKDIFANLLVKTHFTEEKDEREYDYEGDMAKSQLKSIITNAQKLHDMLDDDTNLPEWVQSKITLAEDYVLTAANYMEGELDEEYEIDEEKMTDAQMKRREELVKGMKSADWEKRYPGRGKEVMYATATKMAMKEDLDEEVEQIDEGDLSIRTLYNKWADHYTSSEGNSAKRADAVEKTITKVHGPTVMKHLHKAVNANLRGDFDGEENHFERARTAAEKSGSDRVNATVGKDRSKFRKEEVEQIDELDRKTRVSYLKKTLTQLNNIAGSRHTTGNKTYGSKTVGKRLAGLSRLERNSNHPASVRDNIDKARAQFEEVEHIDELKKSTLGSYINKAANQVRAKTGIAASFETQGTRKKDPEDYETYMNLSKDFRQGAKKRLAGIEKATAKLAKEEVETVDESAKDWKKAFGKVATKNLTKDLASVRSKVHRMDHIGLQPKVSERPVTAKDSKRLDLDALGEEVRYFSGTTVSGKPWKFIPPGEPKMLSPEFVKDRVPTLTDKEAHEVAVVAKDQYNDVDKKFAEMSEAKAGTVPKTPKEKALAAKAHPKHLITHKDVLHARGVKLGEAELREKVREKLGSPGKTMTKKAADPVIFHPMGKKKAK